jgi:hypothetical protein
MARKKNKSPWRLYMSGDAGDSGYYIIKKGQNTKAYGPFKNKKIAEFFNFVAFGDPRSPTTGQDAKVGIQYSDSEPNPIHPNNMLASNSKFSLWWEDIYNTPLNSDLVMKIARATGAQGYQSFTNWLLGGFQIDGKHVMGR